MQRVEQIRGERLLIEATVNGAMRVPVTVFRVGRDVPPEHIAADTFNPRSARERDAFVERLALEYRDEAAQLSTTLGAKLNADHAQAVMSGETAESVPSEDAIADRFSAEHADTLRYVALWGRWLEWRGHRWEEDSTLHVFDLVRATCRAVAEEQESPRRAAQIASAQTVAAVQRLAQADRRHAATPEQFDADPWLLNTPSCTLDLRTGERRPHCPGDHLTKCTAVAPSDVPPARWMRFLNDTTAGDGEVQSFLQRWFGYCLSGDISEEKLFFAWGDGGNGKGTLVGAIAGLLGDYATTAPMEAFTISRGDRHPTELAMLRGARLVTAQETEAGRAWNEQRIKQLTGGDMITARFMRQDFFTFRPTFKLAIFGNHKPAWRTVDRAIRRRLLLVPFTHHVEHPDLTLKEALIAEWGGILTWLVEGCQLWLEQHLRAPACVTDATERYLASEDMMQLWLDERCEVVELSKRKSCPAPLWSSSRELYTSWQQFSEEMGLPPITQKAFATQLEERGFERANGGAAKNTRGFKWIRMLLPLKREGERAR